MLRKFVLATAYKEVSHTLHMKIKHSGSKPTLCSRNCEDLAQDWVMENPNLAKLKNATLLKIV